MAESLGKASLELDANVGPFERNLKVANKSADETQRHLDELAAVSKVATDALHKIKMTAQQTRETSVASDKVKHELAGIEHAAITAAADIARVKIGAKQAAETTVAGDKIDRKLKAITGNANETRRALESVRLAGIGAGGAGGGRDRNPGVGVGPFGSGFGRVGVMGAAVGGAALLGPAAGPAALGLLAAIPVLAATGVGAIGTLALAFQGVGKAIGGDKKAYDALVPSQQQFVLTVRSMKGELDKLKQVAGKSLFPGLTAGLKSALSPATLAAITKAVGQFGRAMGSAGQMVGRYFGGAQFRSIFGPLMKAGATNLRIMARAGLSLFDALGVVGKAAIPFTRWLVTSLASGARWIQTFTRAKAASGALAHGLNEAKTSLRLVAGLVKSLARVVAALGRALYPVSKVAVKDLTNGLNALAGIVRRNQGAIRSIISTALTGLVSIVKGASWAVGKLVDALTHLIGKKANTVAMIAAVGIAIGLWLGPASVGIAGAVLAVGFLVKHWAKVKPFMISLFKSMWLAIKGFTQLGIYGMLLSFKALMEGASHMFSWIPGLGGKIKDALAGAASFIDDFRVRGTADVSAAGSIMSKAWADAFKPDHVPKPHAPHKPPRKPGDTDKPDKPPPGVVPTKPPWTRNLPPAAPLLSDAWTTALTQARENVALAGPGQRAGALQALVALERQALGVLDAQHASGSRLVALGSARVAMANKIAAGEASIASIASKAEKDRANAAAAAARVRAHTEAVHARAGRHRVALARAADTHQAAAAAAQHRKDVATLHAWNTRTGTSLLSEGTQLALAKAKGTVDKKDDIAATQRGINELTKIQKTRPDWNKLPVAKELGLLEASMNRLRHSIDKGFDGFNLTMREHRRHMTDLDRADRYHARAGETHNHNYSPTIVTHDEADQKRKARQEFFRYRALA